MHDQQLTRPRVDQHTKGHEPVVDLVRAVAILVVVIGHWLMQGLYVDASGRLHREGLLGLAPWTHPLTWAMQVMPLVFVVGGYANARSWDRARSRGQNYGAWLHVRVLRLVRPVVPLMLFWAVAAGGAASVGLGRDWLGVASRAALVPTWFLAVYLVVAALTPVAVAGWRRWGWATVAVGLAGAGLVDLISLTTAWEGFGRLNVLVVWATVHQLGVAWQARRLTPGVAGTITVVGLAGLLILVGPGGYALSMVGVDGFGIDNTNPPKVTLALLGLVQAGVTGLLRHRLAGLAQRPAVSSASLLVNAHLMTIYLWHLTALGLATAVSLWAGGVGLRARPDTEAWWWSRPVWLVVLAMVTLVVVQFLGRFELVPRGVQARQPVWPALLVAACVTGGLALLASGALVTADGTRWWLPLVVTVPPMLLRQPRQSSNRLDAA